MSPSPLPPAEDALPDIPEGLLAFSASEPSGKDSIDKACVDGAWISLRKKISQWPKEIANAYQQDLYFLFPTEFKTENYNTRDMVCLCATVTNCPLKPEGLLENRICQQYRRGLCVEASVEANDCEPLALGSIARFHGLSKQRVHQIYNSARKRLILEMSQDEIMQEYMADIFLGNRHLPSPDDIAEFIEKAIQG